ncbi:hypothetical protein SUGI_0083020 [Cryptomeria japonica]|nr:hypothetical protein SUGI_0083020 [Cryptomeria japonica]
MAVVSLNNPIVHLVVLGWVFMGCIGLGLMNIDGAPYVPAMFVFGDSLADTGNNNLIPNCKVRADIIPYGISAFPKPTGRFSDGYITFDYIASFLGLSSPNLLLSHPTSISSGINFASAGSGLLDSTGKRKNVMPLSRQIQKFQNISNMLIKEQGYEKAKFRIANSLFCISIGSNDIAEYIIRMINGVTDPPMEQFARKLFKAYDEHLVELYKSGARKFLLVDVPALGCTPYARQFIDFFAPHSCFPPANDLSIKYNSWLRKLVDHLNQKLDGASIILLDSYSKVMDMIFHAESYGFLETKFACCGSGTLNVSKDCGKTTPPDQYCKDPDTHLFWDWAHPTQKAAKIFADAIWSGNSSVIHPFNLSTLVLARK